MSKAVLISIQPRWCENIAAFSKSLEVRKTKPNIQPPFKCYIYQTRRKWQYKILERLSFFAWVNTLLEGQRKVIGEFTCDYVKTILADDFIVREDAFRAIDGSCLTIQEVKDYAGWKKGKPVWDCKPIYGWHISNLVIYDKPKPLSEFKPWNRICKYSDLGLAIPKCQDCHDCKVERPPQSWCYVEEKEIYETTYMKKKFKSWYLNDTEFGFICEDGERISVCSATNNPEG